MQQKIYTLHGNLNLLSLEHDCPVVWRFILEQKIRLFGKASFVHVFVPPQGIAWYFSPG